MYLAHLIGIVLPVYTIIAIGYLYSRWRQQDMTAANHINMTVLLPALIFHVLSGSQTRLGEYGGLALGALGIIFGSGVLAWLFAKTARLPYKTFVPPMMFSNAGNIGLPIAVFAFGEQALPAAVVLLVIENGLHFTLGIYLMDHRAAPFKVLTQPTILATIVGLVFAHQQWRLPVPLNETVGMLGQASIPLLLFALGTRMTRIDFGEWRIGMLGAIVCPLTGVAMFLILRPFLELTPLQAGMLLVFSVLPPAVLNFLVAEQYRQEPGKVAAIVLIGNLAGLVTLPVALAFALR